MKHLIWNLFRKWVSRLPFREITGQDDELYLTRYFAVVRHNFSVYVHQFHRSDADRDLHDHPWSFVSIILAGGYWEWDHLAYDPTGEGKRLTDRTWYRPGSVLVRQATHRHRVEIDDGNPPWSLVIVGPRVRKWGFWVDRPGGYVWVHWREYLRANGIPIPEGKD